MEIRIHGFEKLVDRNDQEIRRMIATLLKENEHFKANSSAVPISFHPKMKRVDANNKDRGNIVEIIPSCHDTGNKVFVATCVCNALGVEAIEVVILRLSN